MDSHPKPTCAPNIDRKGRIIRAIGGLILFGAAAATYQLHWGIPLALGLGGAFMMFETARGWCALRACRIRTPF